jgi:hypothetical protein
MANMEKIKAAVGQDDLFSCLAPLPHALCKRIRSVDFG